MFYVVLDLSERKEFFERLLQQKERRKQTPLPGNE